MPLGQIEATFMGYPVIDLYDYEWMSWERYCEWHPDVAISFLAAMFNKIISDGEDVAKTSETGKTLVLVCLNEETGSLQLGDGIGQDWDWL